MERVGVVGIGQMGAGIAQVVAAAGYTCRVHDVSREILDRGSSRIRSSFERAVGKGKMTREEADRALLNLHFSDSIEGLSDCELVVEAVSEDFRLKAEVFSQIGPLLGPDAILATNTSSLSVTRLMTCGGRPDRFVGLHFFNPVPVMALVEIVGTIATSRGSLEAVIEFARSLGKTPVMCQDRSGFIVNRLLIPYLLDAIRTLESGVAGLPEIDQAMKLGCGHPMGPFELMDLIGLDTVVAIAETLYAEWREPRFAPPARLLRLVEAGRLGRKSGSGFLEWEGAL